MKIVNKIIALFIIIAMTFSFNCSYATNIVESDNSNSKYKLVLTTDASNIKKGENAIIHVFIENNTSSDGICEVSFGVSRSNAFDGGHIIAGDDWNVDKWGSGFDEIKLSTKNNKMITSNTHVADIELQTSENSGYTSYVISLRNISISDGEHTTNLEDASITFNIVNEEATINDVQLNSLRFQAENTEVNLADIQNKSIKIPAIIEFTGDVGYVEVAFSSENGDSAYYSVIYDYNTEKKELEIAKSKTDLNGTIFNLKEGVRYNLTKIFFYDKTGKYIKRYVTPAFGHEEFGEPTINYNYSFRVLSDSESVSYKIIDGDLTNDETLTEANVSFASILRTNMYGLNSHVGVLPPHSRIKIDYDNEMFNGLNIDKSKTSIDGVTGKNSDTYIYFYNADGELCEFLRLVTEGVTQNHIIEHYNGQEVDENGEYIYDHINASYLKIDIGMTVKEAEEKAKVIMPNRYSTVLSYMNNIRRI